MRTRFALLMAAAGVALSGCAYNGLGMGLGYGSGYGGGYGYGSPYGYGYGSPYGYGNGISYSIGYGNGYGYGYPYGGYGYGYGSPYWGWYDNWYYPGTGNYVYDRYRNRQVWTDAQRRYWTQRLQEAQSRNGVTKIPNTRLHREIWDDFNRQKQTTATSGKVTRTAPTVRTQRVTTDRPTRSERVQQRDTRRAERQTVRSTSRAERQSIRDSRSSSNRRSDRGD